MQHQKSNVIGCCRYDGRVSTKLQTRDLRGMDFSFPLPQGSVLLPQKYILSYPVPARNIYVLFCSRPHNSNIHIDFFSEHRRNLHEMVL